MLKQRKTVPYIAVFKLSSGEEFICKVVEETDSTYVVSNPLTLGQSAQGVQFMPIMMLADPDKNIEVPKPVIVGTPQSNIESQYESLTSGIALPSKGSIIKS